MTKHNTNAGNILNLAPVLLLDSSLLHKYNNEQTRILAAVKLEYWGQDSKTEVRWQLSATAKLLHSFTGRS